MTKVMIFGTFDGLHKGHEFLINEAKTLGDIIVVSLASDETVKYYKDKIPVHNFLQRKNKLLLNKKIVQVIKSDEENGSFKTVDELKPDIILLGHDQNNLKKSLTDWLDFNKKKIKLVVAKAFKPEIYKSSLIQYD